MAAADAASSFARLMQAHKASELVPPNQQMIIVYSDEDPVVGFQRIVNSKVLSAPVYDRAAKKFIGYLDTKDLVAYFVYKAEVTKKEHDEHKGKAHASLAPPPVDIRQIFDVAPRFYQQPMGGVTIPYLAKRHPFYPVLEDDDLLQMARLLALEDCHRVPVMNRSGELKGIISQSTLITFLYKHREEIKDLLQPTVDGIKLGSRPVIPVKSTQTALECFKLMSDLNRSGVAVVDEDGRFVGNTSGSDLKLLIQFPENAARILSLPIIDFLSAIRQLEVSAREKSPTISVRPQDTVEKVVGKLAATRVHRVFVCDDKGGYKPVAVVSLTDVLRYLLGVGVVGSAAKPKITVDSS